MSKNETSTTKMPGPTEQQKGLLYCFFSEGDDARPPTEASIMFLAACILLVLPTMKRALDRHFFQRFVRFLDVSITVGVLAVTMIATTSVHANAFYCFLGNTKLSLIKDIDVMWEPLVSLVLMCLFALLHLFCAWFVSDNVIRVMECIKGRYKKRKPSSQSSSPCRTSSTSSVHLDPFRDVKKTRRGTKY